MKHRIEPFFLENYKEPKGPDEDKNALRSLKDLYKYDGNII